MSSSVQGCPSPPVPATAYAVRQGDTATIICNNSDTSWTTTCKDNKWTEKDRECPAGWTLTEIVKTTKAFPYGKNFLFQNKRDTDVSEGKINLVSN